jgi:hypothetical protein
MEALDLSDGVARSVGRTFEQWQYEVTADGRIWYCPDEGRRVVWVVAFRGTLAGRRRSRR